jgi:hypothetical protein
MNLPTLLAHGALGNWDEIVFLSIAAVFLIVMGISWIRSRAASPDEVDAVEEITEDTPQAESGGHIRLE